MTDQYHLEKQAIEQAEATRTAEVQKADARIAQAEPVSARASSEMTPKSEIAALKTEVGQRQYGESTEANARMRDAAPVSDDPRQRVDVELDRINSTNVKSPVDFKSPEQYEGMRREAEMLKEIRHALDKGANEATFDEWDRAKYIGQYSPDKHIRGFSDTYRSYYTGDEPVALERGSDGTYNVLNGEHRIYVCREAGLKTIPARIVG